MRTAILEFVEPRDVVPELAWIRPFLVVPGCGGIWQEKPWPGVNGASFVERNGGLMVVVSGTVELDGKRWIHVSCSRKNKMPSYEDMARVKTVFLGSERRAIQLFVPKTEHYNHHPYCLHLWHCIDGDGLPDFRDEKGRV